MIGRWLLAAAAACLGWGLVRCAQDLAPEVPAGWELLQPPAPVLWAGLLGELPPDPEALDLAGFASARWGVNGLDLGLLEFDARVPEDGVLVVRFGAPAQRAGPQAPSADPRHPVAPTARPRLDEGVAVVLDRTAGGAVRVLGLDCEAHIPVPPERFHLALEGSLGGSSLTVRLDDGPEVRCHGQLPMGGPSLGSGLRRIQVRNLRLSMRFSARTDDWFRPSFLRGPWPRGLLAALLGLAMAFGAPLPAGATARGIARLRAPTWRGLVLAGLPLLAWPLLGRQDPGLIAQSLRLLHLPVALVVPALLLPAGAALALAALAWHRGLRLALSILGGALALLAGGLALGGWPPDAPGVLLLAAGGAPIALLAWLNHRAPRGTSLFSLGLCALLAAQLELGLRWTSLGDDWDAAAGWALAQQALYALTEERRYRAYPDEGFPVQPPPRRPGVRRIVALGGSSTGGAFQMDDLGLFWPARLGERLASRGWEVVNQGVGGWNSLHIRLYLESDLARLDPDLLVLYLGHNDLEPSTLTMRDAWDRYRSRRGWVAGVSGLLGHSRALSGLRYAMLAATGRRGTVAVPPEDARANLSAITHAAQARGAGVLLVTEGLDPDPAPMAAYGALLREVAQETGGLWLDGAGALHADPSPDLFIDDCHLSVQGHRVLADLIASTLDDAGWIAPAGAAP
ncbi:MAG: GDSL-type esterase/lipase family protein [Pseudomonadota bacterium]